MTGKGAGILEQARSLTREERAELGGPSLLGMFADDPQVIDEVMEEVHRARATWNLRDRS